MPTASVDPSRVNLPRKGLSLLALAELSSREGTLRLISVHEDRR